MKTRILSAVLVCLGLSGCHKDAFIVWQVRAEDGELTTHGDQVLIGIERNGDLSVPHVTQSADDLVIECLAADGSHYGPCDRCSVAVSIRRAPVPDGVEPKPRPKPVSGVACLGKCDPTDAERFVRFRLVPGGGR